MVLLGQSGAKEQGVVPKVTHTDRAVTTHYDDVELSCPEGYEGHFVDVQPGFQAAPTVSWGVYVGGTLEARGEQMYAICLDKKFMEKVRKNPEYLRERPEVHAL